MKSTQVLANRFVAAVCLFAALGLQLPAFAQIQPGLAEVRAIKGTATYTTNGGGAILLKVGAMLSNGATIKTGADSTVDLFLGFNAGVVRIGENSMLALDKLALTDTGADTAVEVQLNLPEGDLYFNVNKLSKASRYEIKMPNGVAGIRGTKGSFSFRPGGGLRPPVVLVEGKLVFVHAPAGGQPVSYVMSAPPAVYFSVTEGIKEAPPALLREVERQLQEAEKKAARNNPAHQQPVERFIEPIMSPGSGTPTRRSVGQIPGQ